MATVKFASILNENGSLAVPKPVADELGILPGDWVHVEVNTCADTSDDGDDSAFERAVAALTNRTPEQIAAAQARALEMYKPERVPPPGMTIFDVVVGKWPGDETDEEIEAALRDLS